MSGTRSNCEKKIENETFKLKLGTTNKNEPYVIYLEGRTFICPTEDDDYSKQISEIKHMFKREISDMAHKSIFFEDGYILNFQVASSGIAVNKKSFLSFQIFLRQNKNNLLKVVDLKNVASENISSLIGKFSEILSSYGFGLSKTKK